LVIGFVRARDSSEGGREEKRKKLTRSEVNLALKIKFECFYLLLFHLEDYIIQSKKARSVLDKTLLPLVELSTMMTTARDGKLDFVFQCFRACCAMFLVDFQSELFIRPTRHWKAFYD
jgi:hypothetical protein